MAHTEATREYTQRFACAHRGTPGRHANRAAASSAYSHSMMKVSWPSRSGDLARAETAGFLACISWLTSAGVVGTEAKSARADNIGTMQGAVPRYTAHTKIVRSSSTFARGRKPRNEGGGDR